MPVTALCKMGKDICNAVQCHITGLMCAKRIMYQSDWQLANCVWILTL